MNDLLSIAGQTMLAFAAALLVLLWANKSKLLILANGNLWRQGELIVFSPSDPLRAFAIAAVPAVLIGAAGIALIITSKARRIARGTSPA
jgi:hypothetical protein